VQAHAANVHALALRRPAVLRIDARDPASELQMSPLISVTIGVFMSTFDSSPNVCIAIIHESRLRFAAVAATRAT
jgi:hypothetical protein